MRFRNFILILAMSFMFAQWAVAGFPPVRIGGILQSLATKFTLLFPAKSVVNRGGVTAYIDTDVSNLLHDGSFEGIALSTDWTFSGGTTSFETADKVDGNQSLRITASASTPVLRQTVSTKSGLPLVVGCMVKTDQNFVEVCAKDSTTDVLCTNVPSDNTWRLLKFPIVAGNDGGIEVRSSQNITGNIDVDKCRVEYSDTTQDIAQSELAFDVNIGGANMVISAVQSSYIPFGDASLDMVINHGSNIEIPCSSPNTSTGLTCSVGVENVGVVFDAQVGKYEICAYFTGYTGPASGASFTTFQLIETANDSASILQEGNTRSEIGGNNTVSNDNSQHIANCGSFEFTTAGKKTIRLMYEKVSTGTITVRGSRNPNLGQTDIHIVGKYYPPKTKIVTQLQEETVETANEFSAKISNTGVVSDENLDWINGNCTISSTSAFSCNFNSNIFTVAPNCSIVVEVNVASLANQRTVMIRSVTSSSLNYSTQFDTTAFAYPTHVICQKQGADYNKSRMIVGQFEQIKTTELCQVEAYGNDAQVISANTEDINFTTEVRDNCNIYDNSGNTGSNSNDAITPIRSGWYIFKVALDLTSGFNLYVTIYKNGAQYKAMTYQAQSGVSSLYDGGSGPIWLEAGSVYTIRTDNSVTLDNSAGESRHFLNVVEIPDTAAIVKNLNEGGGFLQAPNTGNIKTCYYAFGGAGSLTSPTVCSSSPCTEYYDSCGTASPPTRVGTGNYLNLTWASGTWKANTFIHCTADGQENSDGNSTQCDPRGLKVMASNSSGGYYTSPYCVNLASNPVPLDSVVRVKCEGEAP